MKKHIIIGVSIGLVISVIAGSLFLSIFDMELFPPTTKEWAKMLEEFYTEHNEEMNRFVDLCYENEVGLICEGYGYPGGVNSTNCDYEKKINTYYVYSYAPLSSDTEAIFADYFALFKKAKMDNIYIGNKDSRSVTIASGGFTYRLCLAYTEEKKPVEEIIAENYAGDAWYIEEHWYIID